MNSFLEKKKINESLWCSQSSSSSSTITTTTYFNAKHLQYCFIEYYRRRCINRIENFFLHHNYDFVKSRNCEMTIGMNQAYYGSRLIVFGIGPAVFAARATFGWGRGWRAARRTTARRRAAVAVRRRARTATRLGASSLRTTLHNTIPGIMCECVGYNTCWRTMKLETTLVPVMCRFFSTVDDHVWRVWQ